MPAPEPELLDRGPSVRPGPPVPERIGARIATDPDRQAPAPGSDRTTCTGPAVGAAASGDRVAPHQELLQELFAVALGIERVVGPDEDFFSIGGRSMSGVRLTNRIRNLLGVEVRIRDLFLAPTPALLARRIHDSPEHPANGPLKSP
ncbi:acyl carrier protein [Streptomyces sp. NPDC002073]